MWAKHVEHGAVSVDVEIPSGHEGAAAWSADWVLTEGPAEGDGVSGGQMVEVGRDGGGMAEVAHDVAAPLVGVEDHEMEGSPHDAAGLSR